MAPTIVVQQRTRAPLVVAGAAALLVLAMPVLYGLAQNASLGDSRRLAREATEARTEVARLARQVRDLDGDNQDLRQELVDLQKGREIDRQAYGEVQNALSEEQHQVANLREQLAFYRGVMSPQALESGLHVNELRISRLGADRFRYDLVLVQAARQERRANGRAELRLIGRDRVAQRSIGLSELGGPEALPFSFRRFQEFSGEFQLPAGLTPQRVVISLRSDRGDTPQVEQEFEWSRILDGQARPG
jgi:hypothetical protein